MKNVFKIFFLLFHLIFWVKNIEAQNIIQNNTNFNTTSVQITDTLAWYIFNENANDISGYGNNGVIDGQSITSDRFGRPNRAYEFNASLGGISTPFVEQPNSFSLWFQTTNQGNLLSWGSGSEGVYGYILNVLPSGIEFVYNSGDGIENGNTFLPVAKSGLLDGNWHHIVVDIDEVNGVFTFYVDKEIIGTESISEDGLLWAGINSLGLEIGASLTGRMDDLMFLSGNISQQGVNDLYHNLGWAIPENSLVLGYDYTDGFVSDLSGFEFNPSVILGFKAPDRFGNQDQAVEFDGFEQRIEVPAVPTYEKFSFSTWFQTSTDFSNGYRSLVDLFGLSALSIGSNNKLEASIRFGDTDFLILTSETEVNDNLWHHAVLTYDGNNASLYLDGSLVANVSDYGKLFRNSIATYLNIAYIFEPTNSRYYTGNLDDTYYYNYALSTSEIDALYTENNWPNTSTIASYFFNGNVNDDSGNNLNGESVNATLTQDRFSNSDQAYNFEGNVYLSVADNPIFDIGFNTDLAVSGWFKTTSESGILVSKSNQNTGYWIQIPNDGSNTIEFLLLENDLGISVRSSAGFNDGKWHHFVIQTDRDGTSQIYIDGLFNAENSQTLSGGANPDSDGNLFMGGSGGNDNYEGDLDDIQFYNSLLTVNEIENLYTTGNYPNIEMAEIKSDQLEDKLLLSSYYESNSEFGNAMILPNSNIQFILNQDNDRPYGDDDNDGFVDFMGAPISVQQGLYFVGIRNNTRRYLSSEILSVGFIGSALTGNESAWGEDDVDMENLGEGIFQLNDIELFDGEWKIRANDNWNFANWGLASEEGSLAVNGANIPITSGNYNITVDIINKTYVVEKIVEDNSAPNISNLQFDSEIEFGESVNISVQVTDSESSIEEVILYYIIPGVNNFDNPNTQEMQASGNNYTVELPNITEAGLEFKVFAKNGAQLERLTNAQSIVVTYNEGLPIPFNSFGSEQSDYRILSVPMTLENNTVNEVFGNSGLGNYGDINKWRMFHYNNESTSELSGNSSILPGKGYWLIVNQDDISFSTGRGKNVEANSESPYEITLKPGWNLIGNPYPYNVSWSDIQEFNNEEFELRIFNGSFRNGTTLTAFSGGFVNWLNTNDFILRIPRSKLSQSQSRLINDENNQGWEINFVLEKEDIRNELTGLGMHHNAKDGLDQKDQFNLPRFLDYIDLKHDLKANGYYVAKNITAMHNEHTWEFDIESNMELDGMNMKWNLPNNPHIEHNTLMLWDPSSGNLVDMKSTNRYQLRNSDGKDMRVVFGSLDYVNSQIEVNSLRISDPYPNPSSGLINIQYQLPKDQLKSVLTFELYDFKGRLIDRKLIKTSNSGYDVFEWNVRENSKQNLSGIYMMRISNEKNSVNKKVFINY